VGGRRKRCRDGKARKEGGGGSKLPLKENEKRNPNSQKTLSYLISTLMNSTCELEKPKKTRKENRENKQRIGTNSSLRARGRDAAKKNLDESHRLAMRERMGRSPTSRKLHKRKYAAIKKKPGKASSFHLNLTMGFKKKKRKREGTETTKKKT